MFEIVSFKYINFAGQHSTTIRKVDKDFARKLDLNDIKFAVKFREIHKKLENILLASVFLVMKIEKTPNLRFKKFF